MCTDLSHTVLQNNWLTVTNVTIYLIHANCIVFTSVTATLIMSERKTATMSTIFSESTFSKAWIEAYSHHAIFVNDVCIGGLGWSCDRSKRRMVGLKKKKGRVTPVH